MSRPTICLSMIVRDEAHVIRRCLDSVGPYITHAIICDTGSIDNTCVVARAWLKDHSMPGKVLHHPWQDFGHNRTLALQAAAATGCDYIMVIDADEVLHVDDVSVLDVLIHDFYRVEMRFPTISYPRVNFMRANLKNLRYVGRIHEYATADPRPPEFMLDPTKIHMTTPGDGARGQSGTKLQRDVATMEQWTADEPESPRAWFYLAQGYETTQQAEKALVAYQKRTTLGDYAAEVWFSLYRIAKMYAMKPQFWVQAQQHFLLAYEHSPHRAEPLFYLALGHHNRQQDHLALLYLEAATLLEKPIGDLFVEDAVYNHLMHVQYVISLHNCGKHEEARVMACELIAQGRVPTEHRPIIDAIAGTEVAA